MVDPTVGASRKAEHHIMKYSGANHFMPRNTKLKIKQTNKQITTEKQTRFPQSLQEQILNNWKSPIRSHTLMSHVQQVEVQASPVELRRTFQMKTVVVFLASWTSSHRCEFVKVGSIGNGAEDFLTLCFVLCHCRDFPGVHEHHVVSVAVTMYQLFPICYPPERKSQHTDTHLF